MQTRKSIALTESKCTSKIVNNRKTKVKKLAKVNDALNDTSYRDTHNIGRRKSNDSVITYSLNSHLFFDVYAKFDQNNTPRSNGTTKLPRKSNRKSLEKLAGDCEVLRNSVSGDVSTDAMSANECNSNKSSPKALKIICEAPPVNKDDVLISSPQMDVVSPFIIPCQSRKSLPKKVSLSNEYSNKDSSITITETFQNRLDNNTVFKKQLSVKKTKTKLKAHTNVRRRVSERICKAAKNQQKIDVSDDGKVKAIKKGQQNQKPKCEPCEPNSSLDAVAIINCESLSNIKDTKDIEEEMEIEDYNLEIVMELEVETTKEKEALEIILIASKEKKDEPKILELDESFDLVLEIKEDVNNKCSKGKDREGFTHEPLHEEKKKVEERRKDIKETPLSLGTVSKKTSRKSLSCFFDIMATGSQRECERSTVKSMTVVDVANRLREAGDHREPSKSSKGTPASKKIPVSLKKEDESKKTSAEEEENAETLWLWHGDSEEKTIQLQLDGENVTRTCYPAIRHAKDDVVIGVMDCVMIRSIDQEPYLAKITAFFDDQESGKKMMAVLWYYRPEHTDQGRLMWHTDADVYASKHLDTNSVDCIEDKAFVLPIELYCRFMSYQKRQSSTSRQGLTARLVPTIVDHLLTADTDEPKILPLEPSMEMFASSFYYGSNWQTSFPGEMTSSNVFVCRGLYDVSQHQVTVAILPLVQSPVYDPPERCLSVDSAMSISSCNSDSRLDRPSPLALTPESLDLASPPPPPPPPPPSIPSHPHNHIHNHRHPTKVLSSSPLIPLVPLIPRYLAPATAVLAVNGCTVPYQHNGHY